ncbi:MAG: adenylate/guanylate cyclase domain-containing protein [Candidatus Competibacteraceae bacterium]
MNDRSASPREALATVLFADSGSTRLFEKYGAQRGRQIEIQILDVFTTRIGAQGGVVVKAAGDEIMSCFPDPEQAVQAACEIQRALKENSALVGLNIPVKIGLHHGPVLVEEDKIFGDAVNIAARMCALAKTDQIITTQETVGLLPTSLGQMTRNLGQSWVPGKQHEMEIIEIIWRDSTSQTQVVAYQEALMKLLFARLFLEYRGRNIELVPDHRVFKIGRGIGNDLVVSREQVSRSHATIEFRQGKFILVDQSANGTHLLLENGARIFLRREEFTLHDRGTIFLAPIVSEQDPDIIRYSVIQNAQEVYAREHELKKQNQEIHIEIDTTDCAKQVSEIVESEYFKRINALASRLRAERSH